MKIAIGTVQFGQNYGIANSTGKVTKSEVKKILNLSRNSGINTIDTAVSYGDSEQVLGELGVDDFQVITKIPQIPNHINDIEKWINGSIKESLKRLRIQSLYGLLLHNSYSLNNTYGEDIVQVLTSLKSNGIVRKIGVSIYDPIELQFSSLMMPLDLIQAPFNILDRRLEVSGWLNHLDSQGTEIHTRSTFLQGLLLMSLEEMHPYFKQWNHIWAMWKKWQNNHNKSSLEGCIQFALSRSAIDKVVVGIDSLDHLKAILDSSQKGKLQISNNFISNDQKLINPSNWKLN